MTQPLTRRVLQLLLVSVAVSAAMGVYALLLGEFRETQGKLLATTVSISGASTFGLVSGIALERGRLGLVPWLGIAASAVGATLIVIGAWAEVDTSGYWRSTGTIVVVAVAVAHASVVTVGGLSPRFRWVVIAAYALNAALALLVIGAIWGDSDAGGIARWMGTMGILLTAATIAVPVLRRIDRRASLPSPTVVETAAHCPRCGSALADGAADRCLSCGAHFRVVFDA